MQEVPSEHEKELHCAGDRAQVAQRGGESHSQEVLKTHMDTHLCELL